MRQQSTVPVIWTVLYPSDEVRSHSHLMPRLLDWFILSADPCRHIRFCNPWSEWSTTSLHILTQPWLSGFLWHHGGLSHSRHLDQSQQPAKDNLWTQRRLAHHKANSDHIQTLDSDQLPSPQCHSLSIPRPDAEVPAWTFEQKPIKAA